MASRGRWNNYIKSYVPKFERQFRVYLDCHDGSRSFISANLVDSFDPSLIEQDYDGEYVMLDLNFVTKEGVSCTLTVCFDVIYTEGNEFILADDVLQNYCYDNHGIFVEEGEIKVYTRG